MMMASSSPRCFLDVLVSSLLSLLLICCVMMSTSSSSSRFFFVDAQIAASVIPPWMLGEEQTMACFYLNNSDMDFIPQGVTLQWVQTVPEVTDSATVNEVNYSIAIDSTTFFGDPKNVHLVGGASAAAGWRAMVDDPNYSGCTPSNAKATCPLFHINLHSCRHSTEFVSNCLPWVTPLNSTTGNTLVTHTAALVGNLGEYSQRLRLESGSWIIIAHVRIFGSFQCAVGSRRSIAEPQQLITNKALSDGTIVGIAVGFAALLGIFIIVMCYFRSKHEEAVKDFSNAPKSGSMVMLFTDIQSSTTLWSTVPAQMAVALELHNDIIRRSLKRHSGFEVKTIGDAVMCAFINLDDAVAFARDVQLDMQRAEWPSSISSIYHDLATDKFHPGFEYDDDPDDVVCLRDSHPINGLKVRIGLHFGSPKAYFDEVAKSYDYAGNDVNIASRVESAAKGGQILCSQSVVDELARSHNSIATSSDVPSLKVKLRPVGSVQLRGVKGETELLEIIPTELPVRREFPLLNEQDREKLALLEAQELEEQQQSEDVSTIDKTGSDTLQRGASFGSSGQITNPAALLRRRQQKYGLGGGDVVSVMSGMTGGVGGGVGNKATASIGLTDEQIEVAIREIITTRHPLVRLVSAVVNNANSNAHQQSSVVTDEASVLPPPAVTRELSADQHDLTKSINKKQQLQQSSSSSEGPPSLTLRELQCVVRDRMYHHVSLIKPMRSNSDKESFIVNLAKAWRTPVIKKQLAKTLCHLISRTVQTEIAQIIQAREEAFKLLVNNGGVEIVDDGKRIRLLKNYNNNNNVRAHSLLFSSGSLQAMNSESIRLKNGNLNTNNTGNDNSGAFYPTSPKHHQNTTPTKATSSGARFGSSELDRAVSAGEEGIQHNSSANNSGQYQQQEHVLPPHLVTSGGDPQ